ncbi:MAG: hypothetical protein L3J89_11445 [Gammaproteobacteria bacterium]|nr:hypothetical protein [Gammaproteobacteria bacterium]
MLKANKTALHIAILSGTLLLTGCGGNGEGTPVTTDNGPAFSLIGITANTADNTVTIFDADAMTVTYADAALSGVEPTAITLSTDNKTAYVMNSGSNDISIINLLTGSETGTIALTGTRPGRAVIAADGYLYVTFEQSSFIAKVDIAASIPTEVAQINATVEGTEGASTIAATPDGQFLYAAFYEEKGNHYLGKIEIASESMVNNFESTKIADLEIDSNGILHAIPRTLFSRFKSENEEKEGLLRFDTNTDTFTNIVEITYNNMELNDLRLYHGKLFTTANSPGDSGGVAEVSTSFSSDNFAFDSKDDDNYTVDLPFTFTFMGNDYDKVSMNSNGVVSFNGAVNYDQGVDEITGFTPNNEDLDSGNLFHYSSKVYSNRAVFQWLTSTYHGGDNINHFTSFEVVMYPDGQARFDYLFSGPDAILEELSDDQKIEVGYSYGIGNDNDDEDESNDKIVNLRETLGTSPFNITRKSYLWDPATSENTMAEVPFAWEGTGIHFNPAILKDNGENGGGYTSGVGVTDNHIFMTILKDYKSNNRKEIIVYDRDTMLPLDATIPVGYWPEAIEIAKILND